MISENNYDIKSLTTPAATGGTVTTSSNYKKSLQKSRFDN